MAIFDEAAMIINQITGHHGMLEISVHYLASMLSFIAGVLATIYVLYKFEDKNYKIPLAASFFSTSFIGSGEIFEHFFSTFGHDFFHYMHIIAGLTSIFFLYITIEMIQKKETDYFKSNWIVYITFMIMVGLSVIFGYLAETPWDKTIENPVVSILFIPTVIISYLLIRSIIGIIKSKNLLFKPVFTNLLMYTIILLLLSIDILLGRLSTTINSADLYIWTHAFQDLLHGMIALIMIYFMIIVKDRIFLKTFLQQH